MDKNELLKIEDAHMIDEIVSHYLICAIWSSCDDDGNPLDDAYGTEDIHADLLKSSRDDVESFLDLLKREGVKWDDKMTPAQFGHDFWLTRNNHGAGFWDRGYGAVGEALTRWAETFASVDLYVTSTGMVDA